MAKKFYRLNQAISAKELRVVDEKGKQIGILPRNQALQQAQEKGLDLVEVASQAQPPVCKIVNFRKFKFQERKKNQAGQKKSRKAEQKEIRFRPFIAANDLETRLKRAERFLKAGHAVKITVQFRGREMTKRDFGYELLKKTSERLANFGQIIKTPKFINRQLAMTFGPKETKNEKKQSKKTESKKVS